jgi:predicted lipid-binding transport protein (Tim44 family)
MSAMAAETQVDTSSPPSVAAHPRAARSVARAKSWGGLAGFVIAGYLSLPTGTLAEAGLRALVAGSVCYVATWAGAVFVWRRLVVLEIKSREQELLAATKADDKRAESPVVSAEYPNARAA